MSRVNADIEQKLRTLKAEVDASLSKGYDAPPNAREALGRVFHRSSVQDVLRSGVAAPIRRPGDVAPCVHVPAQSLGV